jgi:hypothetical protein
MGDHLSALTTPEMKKKSLRKAIRRAGISNAQVKRSEPTLEDVFLALEEGDAKNIPQEYTN